MGNLCGGFFMEQTRRGSGAPWIMEVAVGHRLWHIAQADETLDPLPPFWAANSPNEASSRIERLQQETGTGRALQGIESQAAWSGWAWGLGGLGAWGLGGLGAWDLAHVPAVEGAAWPQQGAASQNTGTKKNPPKSGRVLQTLAWQLAPPLQSHSGSELLRRHERVVAGFGKAEPEHLVALECAHVGVDLLPLGAFRVVGSEDFHGGLERSVHHGLRERQHLGLGSHQLLEGRRVQRVVLGQHVDVGHVGCGFDDGLVLGRQAVEGLLVDEEV